jgi:hypothetical protein
MKIERVDAGRNTLFGPLPNQMIVVFGPHGGVAAMLDAAARLSLHSPLYVLDCGNRSDMYRVARTLRFLTNDPAAMLQNIRLSRAFTCYQVVALLEKIPAGSGLPVLVLDLLSTFMDESVRLQEAELLFENALQLLEGISSTAPVLISARPLLSISSDRVRLLDALREHAFQVWEESSSPVAAATVELQPALFSDC